MTDFHHLELALPGDARFEVPVAPDSADGPPRFEMLPDGRESVVYGNVGEDVAFNHHQGDNALGFQGDCGLVSCQDILLQNGISVSETDVVRFAADNGLCATGPNAEAAGGTSAEQQALLLRDYGVPAEAEQGLSLQQLAADVRAGDPAIIEVNAGVLWNDPNYVDNGSANHAVTVTGVALDPVSGAVQGCYINDSGTGRSAEFVPVATLQAAWSDTGAVAVITAPAGGGH